MSSRHHGDALHLWDKTKKRNIVCKQILKHFGVGLDNRRRQAKENAKGRARERMEEKALFLLLLTSPEVVYLFPLYGNASKSGGPKLFFLS